MRILIASGIFHPETGGPATYLYQVLPALQAHGHQISVLTFGDGPVSDQYPYPLTRIPRQSYPRRHLDYYQAAARLWPGHDLAYIHSLGLPLPASIRPRIAKIVGDTAWERATNKGWVASNTDIDSFQAQRYSPWVELNKMLRAREARHLDHIIVPSGHRKRMVAGWGVPVSRISVIYNALVRDTDVPVQETQAEARRKLNLPDGPLLLTAARLIPLKGIGYTLQVIAGLKDVRLVIAGDGPMYSALEVQALQAGIAERVIFTGEIPHDDLALYFRAADYTLLYSGGEGLSHVLLESLSLGTPVIASDKGGNPEIVRHGENGLLVPYVDLEALAAALQEAFAPGRRSLLAAGSSVGLGRFTWDQMVRRTVEVLESFG